ncbi:MAG: alpha-mannosidase [Clostridia bacterium]|nr:alpha-mannosidase [Clostridia bacterium]
MKELFERFIRLKTRVAGNREQKAFEYSFGVTVHEKDGITPMTRWNERILSEAEFALRLSEANEGAFDKEVISCFEYLENALDRDGALTDGACEEAEKLLMTLSEAAKSYKLILTGHAHIDMNWMWSWQETVAVTLATFTTMCDIMDEYPDFTFTQSQGSVYRIVEEYDPELMRRIKQRIDEGRWEVAATSWVESDKNMPSGESLLKHIELTRKYLKEVWGVKQFDLDFVPDTFGHALTIPEIDAFGGVKYMYHCRGNDLDEYLYRYRAASGAEILLLKEANWYNGSIKPHIAHGLFDVVKRQSGLKTGMVVYGVGDHGGGPTRRDVEAALRMQKWPVFPTIRFGGLRDYFREAEQVRDKTPVVTEEINYFAQGCYTTQSRIKRGNRRMENALIDTRALTALAKVQTGHACDKAKLEEAQRDVLFTHFHDILTGSCVQDSREWAMGLYQKTASVTNTLSQQAMSAVCKNLDTISLKVFAAPEDFSYTQSEGAGAGWGIESFKGAPSPERGKGLNRAFTLFNTLPYARTAVCELTVWDWTGDLTRLSACDKDGKALRMQLLDRQVQKYWDHMYFRVLVEAEVPALGYTTVALYQAQAENYPSFLLEPERTSGFYDDKVLDNGIIRARVDSRTGRLTEIIDLNMGVNLLKDGESAGLCFLETERATSSAWNIGRTIKENEVDRCVELKTLADGKLRQSVKATFLMDGICRMPSKAEVTYHLDADSDAIRVELKVDWQEQGHEIIPVLSYRCPLKALTGAFECLIPQGRITRKVVNNDVPAFAVTAENGLGTALTLTSDCKYGYRLGCDSLSVTLINSATNPDPYPERGIHEINLYLRAGTGLQPEMTADLNSHPILYQSVGAHAGTLPLEAGLIKEIRGSVAVTSIDEADGSLILRGYETAGKAGEAEIEFAMPISCAYKRTLKENEREEYLPLKAGRVTFPVRAHGIWMIEVK